MIRWFRRLQRGTQSKGRMISGGDGRERDIPELTLFDLGQVFRGEVTRFDPYVGLGTVRLATQPSREVRFHCITIDDGSRSVGVGTLVTVRLKASFGAELEVASLHKLP